MHQSAPQLGRFSPCVREKSYEQVNSDLRGQNGVLARRHQDRSLQATGRAQPHFSHIPGQ